MHPLLISVPLDHYAFFVGAWLVIFGFTLGW
jgi:hypothetical protein